MSESLVVAADHSEAVPPPTVIAVAMAKERENLLRDIGSGIKLTAAQKAIFSRHASLDTVDILPTGEIYVPGDKWRALLNEAFDPGGWGVRPGQIHQHFHEKVDKSVLYREVFLVVSRCEKCLQSISVCVCKTRKARAVALSTAIGAMLYHPSNSRMTLDDAAEGATTNGIMRCCKPLGIFANIWDRKWAEEAKAQIAIMVVQVDWRGNEKDHWRRWDRGPLPGEKMLAAGSPNADKYVSPTAQPQKAESQSKRATKVADAPVIDVKVSEAQRASGETIKTIRLAATSSGKLWVVSTDCGEYVTFDERLMLTLENFKARAIKVAIDTETVTTTRGPRKGILEVRAMK